MQRIRWFVLGAVAVALLVGAIWAGMSQFNSEAHAEGTWQYELFDTSSINNGYTDADPDRYIDDWIKTLPASCDIVPVQTQPLVIAYRCP